jgi:putative nucleotidyltransferase with HDIG domain
MTSRSFWVYAYVFAVAVATALLLRESLVRWPLAESELLPVALFAVFMLAIELFEVRTAIGARWNAAATVDLAIWIIFGPAWVMLVELVAVPIGDGVVKRQPPIKVIFNACSNSLAAGLAGVTYMLIPGSEDLTKPIFLVGAVVSLFVFSAMNHLVTGMIIAISSGQRIRDVMGEVFGWHFLTGQASTPLAAFFVFSYEFAGLWSLGLFGIPLYMVYQAHRLFEEMRRAYKSTVAALSTALEADEPYTLGHSYRVAQYALRIGRRMRMSSHDLETLEYAGMLHDIGKIAITNDIVCKPARLSKEEFDILASHPAIGGEIVEQMDFLRDAADLVRHHHERPDGQGYPDGLKGDEISLGSHILNLCDAIDAMCSNRPYRAALSMDQCLEEVLRFRGTQFEASVVDVFEAMVRDGEFEIIEQSDGAALKIQDILKKAAEESARKRARLLTRDRSQAA